MASADTLAPEPAMTLPIPLTIYHRNEYQDGHEVHIYRYEPASDAAAFALFCHVLHAQDANGRTSSTAVSVFDPYAVQDLFERHGAQANIVWS